MMTRELNDIRSALDVVADILAGLRTRLDTLTSDDTCPVCKVPLAGHVCIAPPHARHHDAVTGDVPSGYDTILGYLAKRHPDVLDTIDYRDPSVTVRDGFKLRHMAHCAHYDALYVEAPSCLRAAGIDKVRAYPVALLQQRWG